MYKGTPMKLWDFSAEIFQARREWHNILTMLKENIPTKNTLPGKVIYN